MRRIALSCSDWPAKRPQELIPIKSKRNCRRSGNPAFRRMLSSTKTWLCLAKMPSGCKATTFLASGDTKVPDLKADRYSGKPQVVSQFESGQELNDWISTIQPYSAEKTRDDSDFGLNVTLELLHNCARKDRHRRLHVAAVVPRSIEYIYNCNGKSAYVY